MPAAHYMIVNYSETDKSNSVVANNRIYRIVFDPHITKQSGISSYISDEFRSPQRSAISEIYCFILIMHILKNHLFSATEYRLAVRSDSSVRILYFVSK